MDIYAVIGHKVQTICHWACTGADRRSPLAQPLISVKIQTTCFGCGRGRGRRRSSATLMQDQLRMYLLYFVTYYV